MLVTCRERGDEQEWGGGSSSAPDGDEKEVIAVTRGAKEEAQQLENKIKEPQPGGDAHETSDDHSQPGPLDGPISELTSEVRVLGRTRLMILVSVVLFVLRRATEDMALCELLF